MDAMRALKQINNMLEANINERLREYGITITQLDVLIYLYRNNDKAVSQKDICEFLKVKHTSLIDVLKRLESKLLIRRTANKDNARFNCVSLTDKAKSLVKSMENNRENMNHIVYSGFSDDEIRQLEYLLNKIINNLERR